RARPGRRAPSRARDGERRGRSGARRRSVGHLPARPVEVAPGVALLHHRLEVLAPCHGVLDGLADDRAREPGRDVARGLPAAAEAGSGSTTVLKRRLSAADSSLTPRSRLLAVAMTLKPLIAWTSSPSSATGRAFSERIVISASCTSAGIRVSSSIRTSLPAA